MATWRDKKLADCSVCFGGVHALNPDRFVDTEQGQALIRIFNIQKPPTFLILIPARGIVLYRDDGDFLKNPDRVINLALKYVEGS